MPVWVSLHSFLQFRLGHQLMLAMWLIYDRVCLHCILFETRPLGSFINFMLLFMYFYVTTVTMVTVLFTFMLLF